MENYVNWFNHILSLSSIFFMIIAIFSTSVINVLLCTVLIVLMQSMLLIKLEVVVVGSLIMIIYFGAIVILFSFMVLFLGQINGEQETKNYNPFTTLIFILLVIHLKVITNFSEKNGINHTSCSKTNSTNQNVMISSSGKLEMNLEEYSLLSEIMYGQLAGILVLVTLILGLVLILILLMINPPRVKK